MNPHLERNPIHTLDKLPGELLEAISLIAGAFQGRVVVPIAESASDATIEALAAKFAEVNVTVNRDTRKLRMPWQSTGTATYINVLVFDGQARAERAA